MIASARKVDFLLDQNKNVSPASCASTTADESLTNQVELATSPLSPSIPEEDSCAGHVELAQHRIIESLLHRNAQLTYTAKTLQEKVAELHMALHDMYSQQQSSPPGLVLEPSIMLDPQPASYPNGSSTVFITDGKKDSDLGMRKYSLPLLLQMRAAASAECCKPPNPNVLPTTKHISSIQDNYLSTASAARTSSSSFSKSPPSKETVGLLPIPGSVPPHQAQPQNYNSPPQYHPMVPLVTQPPQESEIAEIHIKAGLPLLDISKASQPASAQVSRAGSPRSGEALRFKLSPWALKKQLESAMSDHDKLVRKLRAILNKLTMERFESLSKQILDSGISSEEDVKAIVSMIFEKATTQHGFISMYSELCVRLNNTFEDEGVGLDRKEKSFRRILLDQCQDSFNKYLQRPADEDVASEESYFKYKMKMIGNIKFIGELIANRMLSTRVVFEVGKECLSRGEEAHYETLCELLKIIGPNFDRKKEFGRQKQFDAVFYNLADAAADPKQGVRVRCLLKDILELRASNWKNLRVNLTKPLPMKLKHVRRLAAGDTALTPAQRHVAASRRQINRFDDEKIEEGSLSRTLTL
eukprot:GHVL01012450.1.p1 GENE.GHVL01012450.1~~GHVL01012450.1.p1  ORF type:complete len:585 (-),score=64.17 GHVL01012450.1:3165-4919(-)